MQATFLCTWPWWFCLLIERGATNSTVATKGEEEVTLCWWSLPQNPGSRVPAVIFRESLQLWRSSRVLWVAGLMIMIIKNALRPCNSCHHIPDKNC